MSRAVTFALALALGLVAGFNFGAAVYTRGNGAIVGFMLALAAALVAGVLGFVIVRRDHR